MQLELSFDGGVLQETEVKANKLPRIHSFRLDFPDPKNYFGIAGTNPLASPFEKKKSFSDQQGLFGDEPALIKMAVSDFILAHKCPKIFNAYWLEKSPDRPPHHPVFDVGTKIDTAAKKYLSQPISTRRKSQKQWRENLRQEIEKLERWDDLQRTESYLEAFDSFCEYFESAKLSNRIAPNEWLEFELEGFRLGGKIDLLVQDWQDHKNLLLDLKLEKFGEGVQKLRFPDIVQIVLYAYELQRRGVEIQEVGYYYFKERTLLVFSVSTTELQQFYEAIKRLTGSLKTTTGFTPRKCELCLICVLRKDCEIGRKLSEKDFDNPLE